MTPSSNSRRIPGLDGVRGWAILLVLGLHFFLDHVPTDSRGLVWAWASLSGAGGVDVFFFMSSYLVGPLIERNTSVRSFYLRRSARLLGPLWLVLALAAGWPSDVPLWAGALMLTGFWTAVGISGSAAFTVLWSLTVEEFFYLFGLPLARVCKQHDKLSHVLVVISVFSIAVRIGSVASGHPSVAFALPIARLDGIALGWLCARGAWMPSRRLVIWAALASMGLPFIWHQFGIGPVRVVAPIVYSAFGAGIFAYDIRSPPTWLVWPWLRWCGRRCYGLYLYHLPIFYLIPSAPVALAVTVVAVEASWRLIESPMVARARALTTPSILGEREQPLR